MDYLQWIEDNKYSVSIPKDKTSFREKLTEEIESCGFVHEKIKSFVRGEYFCELVTFTLYATPAGVFVIPAVYYIYFVYDCRNAVSYSAAGGELISCEIFNEFDAVNSAARNAVDSLINSEQNGVVKLDS